MHFRVAVVCLFFALFPFSVEAVPPGLIQVHNRSDYFSVEANDAPLVDVLVAINEVTGPRLRFTDVPDRHVTVRYHDLELNEVLNRLGVTYVLSYEPTSEKLVSGWMAGGIDGYHPFADLYLPGMSPDWVEQVIGHMESLRSDDVRFNAVYSMWELRKEGERVVPYLERALGEDDYQMQQFAAGILMEQPEGYQPTLRLLKVMVEGLADDAFPYGRMGGKPFRYTDLRNARNGLEAFLAKPFWVDQAEARLVQALHSTDGQQRFLAALLLAEHEKKAYVQDLVRVLAPHLVDNMLRSDARMAAHALRKLGVHAKPMLRSYLGSGDEQQERYVKLLLDVSDDRSWSFPRYSMSGWDPELFPNLDGVYMK